MKRFLILIVLITIYIVFNIVVVHSKEKNNKAITLTFTDNNILVTNRQNTIILLDNVYENKNSINNVISINNVVKNFKYDKEYLLNGKILIDDVFYSNNNIMKVSYNDSNFCIYNNEAINTNFCNFLYIFDIKNINNIKIDENINVIFINEDLSIPTYFLEEVYSKWIDIYRFNNNSRTVLKLSDEDYQILVIPNK